MKTIYKHRHTTVAVRLIWRPRARTLQLRIRSRHGVLVKEIALRRHHRLQPLTALARHEAARR